MSNAEVTLSPFDQIKAILHAHFDAFEEDGTHPSDDSWDVVTEALGDEPDGVLFDRAHREVMEERQSDREERQAEDYASCEAYSYDRECGDDF